MFMLWIQPLVESIRYPDRSVSQLRISKVRTQSRSRESEMSSAQRRRLRRIGRRSAFRGGVTQKEKQFLINVAGFRHVRLAVIKQADFAEAAR